VGLLQEHAKSIPFSFDVISLILSAVYFFLPAYVANMAPVFAAALRLPFSAPISSRLFGRNKTWRGLLSGIVGAWLTLVLQHFLQQYGLLQTWRLLDYGSINILLYGFLFGGGAIIGDMVGSFLKRRLKKVEGQPWIPFDQINFVIGALLFLSPLYQLDIPHILTLFLLSPLLHFLTCVLGYAAGMKEHWW
jgi:CDP-2,3-bis-(O-geranylgeranyl)-sn-glycerol synthase